MDFAGNALAPNVLLIKKHLADLSAEQLQKGEPRLTYQFPQRGNKERKPAVNLNSDSLIGLQAGFGFAPFLDHRARAALFGLEPGLVSVYPETLSTAFVDAGLIGASPLTIYSVSPFIMMVDKTALGDAPLPRRWEDLLDPRFERQVVITAEEASTNIAFLSYYSMFGAEGVRRLMRNVSQAVSASAMPSLARQRSHSAGSVYLAPWFFAQCSRANENIAIVWPEEGALSFPLWLAMREGAPRGSHVIASFFTGADFARESAQACLPAVNAASDEDLSHDCAALHWVGWDFLENLDVESYVDLIDSLPMPEGTAVRP